jgi:hypothetical protein
MTVEELKSQLTEIGAGGVRISWMYEVYVVTVYWPDGTTMSGVDVDLEQAVVAAVALGARRGAVS